MSNTVIGLVTLAYAYVALNEIRQGNGPVGLMFIGYAIANIGIMGTTK